MGGGALHAPQLAAGCAAASLTGTWDLEAETSSEYFKNHAVIREYISSGPRDANHSREVAKCIRPLLEGYFRSKFPNEFGLKEWLGDLLGKINRAEDNTPLYSMKSKYSEICYINEYSKKYHHDQNPGADSEPINDTELKSFAERTLKIIYS